MTGKELWGSILQKAMEGKLVPQRKEEGTAAELLKEIRKEKAKLVKEGKRKKTKPLPAVSEEEKPFDIPDSWEWVRLRDIVYNHGQKKPTEKFSYIDIGSIDNTSQKLNDSEKIIMPEKAPSRARRIVQLGDILYATVRPYLHNMCIVDKTLSYPPIASTGFAVMATFEGVERKYLFYFLLSPAFDSYANSNQNAKGVAYPAINDKALYNALIPLPPLFEQHRIVDKLETLKPLVDAYGQAAEELDELNRKFPGDLKKSLLQQAMEGKLVSQRKEEGTAAELLKEIREEKSKLVKEGKLKKTKPLPAVSEEEKPFDIPDSWEWVRLKNLCQTIVDCPHSTPKYLKEDTGFAAIDTNCINANGEIIGLRYVSEDTYYNRTVRLIPKKDDIVFTREGSFGRAAIIPYDGNFCLGQRVMLLRLPSKIDVLFIKMILMAPETINRLTRKQKGLGAKHINVSDVCNLALPLPPLFEQQRIVKQLESLLALCDKLQPED